MGRIDRVLPAPQSYELYDSEDPALSSISASNARDGFGDTLSRVAYAKERVVVSRRGKPLAALIPLEDLQRLDELDRRRDRPSRVRERGAPTLALLRAERRKILRVAARYGATDVRVFGSLARGEGSPTSDVDLLMDLPEGISLMEHAALVVDLQDLLGTPVDVVPERSLRPELREQVLREAISL